MRAFLTENSLTIGYVLGALIIIGLLVWVHRDASARERRFGQAPLGVAPAVIWPVVMFFVPILTLVVYLLARRHQDRHAAPVG